MKRKGLLNSLLNNPVYIKEQYSLKRSQGLSRKVLFWLPLILLLSISGSMTLFCKYSSNAKFLEYQEPARTHFSLSIILGFYFLFKAISTASPLFSAEKEKMTFQPLISSLLSPFEIIAGKFLTAFIPIFKEFCIYASVSLIITTADEFMSGLFIIIGLLCAIQLIMIITSIIVTMWISNRTSKTTEVHRYSTLIMILLFVLAYAFWNSFLRFFTFENVILTFLYLLPFFIIIWIVFYLLLYRDLSRIPTK